MNTKRTTNTLVAFKELLTERQGGALSYSSKGYYPLSSPLYTWASKAPQGYKPFIISIFKNDGGGEAYGESFGEDLVTLGLFINPRDLQIGNVYISSNAYTRKGWVSTLWGAQQSTISANGSTAGFYHQAGTASGLTNFSRKDAVSFINFLSLVSLFKNNGANYSKQETDIDMYKSGFSRVINVMDSIKISYDESQFLGEFISFTLEEDSTQPYKLNYSFEYVINGIRDDSPYIEGHIRTNEYNIKTPTLINIQGSDTDFQTIVQTDDNAIRKNAFVDLKEFTGQISQAQADLVDQVSRSGNVIAVVTEDQRKNSASLVQAQIEAGGKPVSKSWAAKQINNIRKFNKDVACVKVGISISAEEAIQKVNTKLNLSDKSTKVTIEQMSGILLQENDVGVALRGGSLAHPDSTSARGLTQIVRGTYSDIVNNTSFVEFMVTSFPGSYTEDQIRSAHPGKNGTGLLDTDPFLGYMAGVYYLGTTVNPRIVRDGLTPTPQVSGLAYHNGTGSYDNKITQEGANYATSIDTYSEYLKNPNKSTNDLR